MWVCIYVCETQFDDRFRHGIISRPAVLIVHNVYIKLYSISDIVHCSRINVAKVTQYLYVCLRVHFVCVCALKHIRRFR